MFDRTGRLFGGLLLVLTLGVVGCDDFVEVRNPMQLEADQVDPERDGDMFSLSAFQNFIVAYGNLIINTAWSTGEAWVGDTFPTRNEFGRRDVVDTNGTHSTENWTALQRAISSSESVIRTLQGTPGPALARAYLTSGYGILMMAELFCEGTIAESERETGPPINTAQMVTEAISRLEQARSVGGDEIAMAATVGLARIHHFAGNAGQAAQFADMVPADFVFDLPHIDDAGNRGRLGNNVWAFSVSRLSLVVPPDLRERADAGDPRVAYQDADRISQDGDLWFYHQMKYTGWGSPVPLAHGLEARYIGVEARSDAAEMLAFINERRAVGGQDAFDSADPQALLTELLTQRGYDLWLEGKRMGDLRRHGNDLPWVLQPGPNYYKPQLGPVENQMCWPVPDAEKRNNPKWPT